MRELIQGSRTSKAKEKDDYYLIPIGSQAQTGVLNISVKNDRDYLNNGFVLCSICLFYSELIIDPNLDTHKK